ncbi:2OG-Fe(II) oxygenase [Paracoccus sp. (in: a-proteobacteria)]|uniref:2OG-Fe(II) oxygenase n=1 Tax=Paracoccus sp. TaxID=267 RepID=UPI0026E06FA9|nr:2OG-Fe(II) oxygenase [Paracoccus sp. (in: a-proteobacteria)]MDO5648779.1 2OG-Fe(II) oxygenase [Paracoccus sp. (in: a-proteobacteria)]
MQNPAYPIDTDSLLIDVKAARELGNAHAAEYQSGDPYHHICIDGFLPETVIDRVQQDLRDLPQADHSFARDQERYKSAYNPERLPKYTRDLFYALNSRPFLLFLEDLTGIKGLIPDPYFMGAGIHKTLNGGHLDIHADFNLHKPMMVERRLNVLIYLNDDWQEEWGGCFEIWDNDMTQMLKRFAPIRNRMVCFSTSSTSMHGNPVPVNHPNGEPRQSIALYYYTATWDDTRREHTTIFKPRPGTEDKWDKKVRRHEMVKDLLPPALHRRIAGKLRRLGL